MSRIGISQTFVLTFVLLLSVGRTGVAENTCSVVVQAVECFGVDGELERQWLDLLPLQSPMCLPRDEIKARISTAKETLLRQEGVGRVEAQMIEVSSATPELASGIYVTFDVLTAQNPYLALIREAPTGEMSMQPELKALLSDYEQAASTAEDHGIWEEEHDGHYDYDDPEVRQIIERMIQQVDRSFDHLIRVLRAGGSAVDRAAAATLLGFATDKPRVSRELVHACNDPAAEVRNNAARSLIPIAEIARQDNALELPLKPFLTMIRFPTASDRNKAGCVIARLVQGNEELGQQVKRDIGPLVVKMADSKQPNNYYTGRNIIKVISGRDYSGHPKGWAGWLDE